MKKRKENRKISMKYNQILIPQDLLFITIQKLTNPLMYSILLSLIHIRVIDPKINNLWTFRLQKE